MTSNIGLVDRSARIVLGLALIAFALGYIFPATGWNFLGWIGVVPILTALFGICPIYAMLGVKTCGVRAS